MTSKVIRVKEIPNALFLSLGRTPLQNNVYMQHMILKELLEQNFLLDLTDNERNNLRIVLKKGGMKNYKELRAMMERMKINEKKVSKEVDVVFSKLKTLVKNRNTKDKGSLFYSDGEDEKSKTWIENFLDVSKPSYANWKDDVVFLKENMNEFCGLKYLEESLESTISSDYSSFEFFRYMAESGDIRAKHNYNVEGKFWVDLFKNIESIVENSNVLLKQEKDIALFMAKFEPELKKGSELKKLLEKQNLEVSARGYIIVKFEDGFSNTFAFRLRKENDEHEHLFRLIDTEFRSNMGFRTIYYKWSNFHLKTETGRIIDFKHDHMFLEAVARWGIGGSIKPEDLPRFPGKQFVEETYTTLDQFGILPVRAYTVVFEDKIPDSDSDTEFDSDLVIEDKKNDSDTESDSDSDLVIEDKKNDSLY
mgnify:CR=1 FL=1